VRGVVVFDVEDIWFAADLAVFYVNLAAAGGLIDDGRIPFSARGTLEARFHVARSIRYSYRFRSEAAERISSMATGFTTGSMVAHNMVTTQFELDGYRVTRTLGVVRGIVVRSRSIFGTIGAGLQTLVGGNITLLTNLCEKTRQDAFDLMLKHAAELGGNAVVGARYDATEVMQGVTEVLAYGTAVFVEPAR
jgi:uncharacterized protein YbjQ (UPF0145 family)